MLLRLFSLCIIFSVGLSYVCRISKTHSNNFLKSGNSVQKLSTSLNLFKLGIEDEVHKKDALEPDLLEFNNLASNEKKEEGVQLSSWTAKAVLLFVAALYGTNFGCVKILGESLDPSVAAFLRFGISALVFLPNVFYVLKARPEVILAGMEVGIYSTIGYLSQAVALQTTPASTAAFICSLAVIVVPILDILFDEKRKAAPWQKTLLPALLAAAGVGFLELGGDQVPGFGDLICLLQPIFFGLCFWRSERHTRSFPLPVETRAFTGAMLASVAFFSFLWAGVVVLLPSVGSDTTFSSVIDIMLGQIQPLFVDWHVGAAILWTGLITTALTCYGENVAMVKLSAAESTVIYSTEPLWGTAFAAVTLGEQIGWNTVMGAILVLIACIWSSVGPDFLKTAGIAATGVTASSEIPGMLENMQMNWNDLTAKIMGMFESS